MMPEVNQKTTIGMRKGARCIVSMLLGTFPVGATVNGTGLTSNPAAAQVKGSGHLPMPPATGEMGFVVYSFLSPAMPAREGCPDTPVLNTREHFLASLPAGERERLQKPGNEAEFNARWQASMMGPGGINMCSHYDRFPDRPGLPPLQSRYAWGLNLDGDDGSGSSRQEGCAHQNFTSPDGETGIDNESYRAMGCSFGRRAEAPAAEQDNRLRGINGFLASGEFTQVLLLRGVDSLDHDDDVEVIYGNTPDRPVIDSNSDYVWGTSFTISDKAPRERNRLRGRIVNGVLTTEPTLIKLTQTWGQSRERDLRGHRSRWTLYSGRLRLSFQLDGTLKGLVGGYQPMYEFIQAPSIGGMGSLMAGIDCARTYNSLKRLADGVRDPKTGECTAISTAIELKAVPAFVNDVPAKRQVTSN
jgi:hypothetical protein